MKGKQKVAAILSLVLVSVLVFVLAKFILPSLTSQTGEMIQEEVETKGSIIPSQVLNSKAKYTQQNIVIRGRVALERVVCEKKKCPVDDVCCGCPQLRNLVIKDPGKTLTSESEGLLRLLDSKLQPFCQRSKTSCDYDCQDWVDNAIYDVSGLFFAEPPPTGWKMSFDYYFQVEDKEPVKKVGTVDIIKNIFNEAVSKVKEWTTSGSYVLD
ncbi:MAG TPA: hypothetical protein VMX76_02075 [Nevskiaceae bacterium]|nr:hypothetical protein [Nevskiaceae bacterium]